MTRKFRARRRLAQLALTLGATFAAFLAFSPVGQAATCTALPTSTIFSSFNDFNNYFAMPGGSFEAGAPGWSFQNAGIVGATNDTFTTGSHALKLSNAGSVTSAPICINPQIPMLRFFVKSNVAAGSTGNYSQLNVSALIKNSAGSQLTYFLGQLQGSSYGSWTLSPQFTWGKQFDSWLFQADGTATLQLQLTYQGQGGQWWIDDVYVDPVLRT
jgi:hypothetical protein